MKNSKINLLPNFSLLAVVHFTKILTVKKLEVDLKIISVAVWINPDPSGSPPLLAKGLVLHQ